MNNVKALKDIDSIKKNITNMANSVSYELAKAAETDLIAAHNQIINNYYKYNPTSYKRHKRHGFHDSLISHSKSVKKGIGYASIEIGSRNMTAHYRTDSENVFDLIWNHGVRGLPRYGNEPLSHSFDWFTPTGKKHWEAGEKWENLFWNREIYQNIFLTTVNVNGNKTSKPKVPNKVMEEFVDNWWDKTGSVLCEKIIKTL